MWLFLAAILFVVLVIIFVLIFYVGPDLVPAVFGPTGATGPTDYEELETTVQFFDGLASVISNLHISAVRIGHQVTLTIPGFSFDDAALPRTGQITSAAAMPADMRPLSTTNMMLTTFSNVRKIGMLSVNSSGDLIISVNAQVNNLITGDAWIAVGNVAGNVSITYTTL
jgi:hypothetical protein